MRKTSLHTLAPSADVIMISLPSPVIRDIKMPKEFEKIARNLMLLTNFELGMIIPKADSIYGIGAFILHFDIFLIFFLLLRYTDKNRIRSSI